MGILNRRKFCLACGKRIFGDGNYCRGHNASTKPKPIPNHHECACGCGELIASDKTYKKGHHKGMLGKHPTEETLVKMRAPKSEAFKKNLSIVNTGRLCKEETKVKLRKPKTEEHKQKQRHPHSPEGLEANRKAQNTVSAKENKRKAQQKRYDNPEERIKRSVNLLEFWSDPERKEKRIKAIGKGLEIKPNRPETLIKNKVCNEKSKIIYCGDYSVIINGKNPDFICFEKKKIIEFNGSYWHKYDIPGERELIFAAWGYDTLILVDEDLLDMDKLQIKVDEFMERPNPYCGNVERQILIFNKDENLFI